MTQTFFVFASPILKIELQRCAKKASRNDIMRNRQSLISCCARAATFIKIQKKYFRPKRAEINRPENAQHETMRRQRNDSKRSAGRSLSLRPMPMGDHQLCDLNSIHSTLWPLISCTEFRKKEVKHAKRLVNEIRNKSRQRIKSSKSAPEHEEADSAYHQRISGLLAEHAIDQFSLFYAVHISTAMAVITCGYIKC